MVNTVMIVKIYLIVLMVETVAIIWLIQLPGLVGNAG